MIAIRQKQWEKLVLALMWAGIFCPGILCQDNPVAAEEVRNCVDWKRLRLGEQQSQQIQTLEQDWNTKYLSIQPQLIEQQHKLSKLLLDPASDPLEIIAVQQKIAHLKEQLNNEATHNFLRKRAILNGNQQHQLEAMMQQLVIEKQHSTPNSSYTDEHGNFLNILQKVRWAIQH